MEGLKDECDRSEIQKSKNSTQDPFVVHVYSHFGVSQFPEANSAIVYIEGVCPSLFRLKGESSTALIEGVLGFLMDNTPQRIFQQEA